MDGVNSNPGSNWNSTSITSNENQCEPLQHRKTRRRISRFTSIFILPLFSFILLFYSLNSNLTLSNQLSIIQKCKMSRMRPAYLDYSDQLLQFTQDRSNHLDSLQQQLTKKYSLYLYRERFLHSKDEPDLKNGRPALFVPGNAGSYGQVRSVASSSAKWFWKHDHDGLSVGTEQKNEEWKDNGREVDWWTIDFNEDFSAFHGSTLEAQSKYLNLVLTFLQDLYSNSVPPNQDSITTPSQVGSSPRILILAHSMGGIVSRLALLDPKDHPKNSVNTIITLSTPHSIPPLSLSNSIEKKYEMINDGFYIQDTNKDDKVQDLDYLKEILLISISGGLLDSQIIPESTSLSLSRLWLSESNSLNLFTSGINGLWSSCDHLAIMWCDQLRSRIARASLIDSALQKKDSKSNLKERRELWRKSLGIQDEVDLRNEKLDLESIRESKEEIIEIVKNDLDKAIENLNKENLDLKKQIFYSLDKFGEEGHLEILTDLNPGLDPIAYPSYPVKSEIKVSICNEDTSNLDSEPSTTPILKLRCSHIPSSQFSTLPPSPHLKASTDKEREEAFPDLNVNYASGYGYHRLTLNLKQAGGRILRVEQIEGKGWIDIRTKKDTKTIDINPFNIGSILISFEEDGSSSSLEEVILPNLDSGILGYQVELLLNDEITSVSSKSKSDFDLIQDLISKQKFQSFLKVKHLSSLDLKYFQSLQPLTSSSSSSFKNSIINFSLHGESPFILPSNNGHKGSQFSIWMDSIQFERDDGQKVEVKLFKGMKIKLDWKITFGNLIGKSRSFAIGLPVALMFLNGVDTWRNWDRVGHFSSPLATILQLPIRNFKFLLISNLSFWSIQHLLLHFSPATTSPSSRFLQNLFSGYSLSLFPISILIFPLLLFLSWGLLLLETLIVSVSVEAASLFISLLGLRFKCSFPVTSKIQETSQSRIGFSKRTLAFISTLLILTFSLVPHQFVFLCLVLCQLINTLRSRLSLTSSRSSFSILEDFNSHEHKTHEGYKRLNENNSVEENEDDRNPKKFEERRSFQSSSQSRFNSNLYILIFLIILLPFKAPVLIVWVRNLMVLFKKIKPTSYGELKVGMGLGDDDHEAFRIIGVLLIVQVMAGGRGIGRAVSRIESKVTEYLLFAFAVASMALGIRYTYRLFDFFNLLLCWLLLVHYRSRKSRSDRSATSLDSSSTPMAARTQAAVEERDSEDEIKIRSSEILRMTIPSDVLVQKTRTQVQSQADEPSSLNSTSNSLDATERLEEKLKSYLETLDLFESSQKQIGESFKNGFLDLSRGKMALATSSGGSWRGSTLVHDMWDNRMKSCFKVKVEESEGTADSTSRFKLEKVEMANEVVKKEKLEGKAQVEESNLRRRKGKDPESKTQTTASTSDSATSPREDKENDKKPPLPPNPLYQFGGLPPAKLRTSQAHFQQAIASLIGSEEKQGSMNLRFKLEELEAEIEQIRREMKGEETSSR